MPGADQGKSTEAHRDEIQDYLKNKDYRFVVSTDVRDVIFQRNPSEWLENHLENSPHSIVSASEAIQRDSHCSYTRQIFSG